MNRFPLNQVTTAMALAAMLSACSTIESTVAGDKIDYRSAQAKATPLDIPPDLTQLAIDPRFAPQSGIISASALQSASAAASAPTVNQAAPQSLGHVRLERQGNLRYLVTTIPPEQLWPQLQAFWTERGFALTVDQPELGVMETDWAENRAKLPSDFIRNTIGKIFDSLFSTGELDKYRTRVERSAQGTEIFISHRGFEEAYTGASKDSTTWKSRPSDPLLEGEMLSRLMLKLGANDEQAKAVITQTASAQPAPPARARVRVGSAAASLQVDEGFDRAWRRVGLSLDRSGFTVEDRDRSQGIYFVRYVDPAQAGKEEPGFFSRLFSKDSSKLSGPVRYQVKIKSEGETQSTVTVFDSKGTPENGEAGQRIVKLLVDDLK